MSIMPTLQHSLGITDFERSGPAGHRPLVLFHTLLADRSVYDEIFPTLAQKRDVIRFQFPGFGLSSGQCQSIDDYASWTIAFLKALNLPCPADIFSNGFGGFVSVGVTSRAPELVGQLTIANSGAAFPSERKPPLLNMARLVETQGIDSVLDTAISRMFPESFASANPEIVKARKKALSETDSKQFALACRALENLDYRDLAKSITRPVHIVAGLNDATTPPAMSQELHSLISGSRYSEIDDCGHCPQIQQSQKVLELLA
jgi:3-oxoadipate enol-lactonase